MRTRVFVCAMVAATAALTAGNAHAAVYCVPTLTPSCSASRATLAQAITAANAASDPDTIVLAAGTFTGGANLNYETHVIGAGQDRTVIEGGTSGYGLYLQTDSSSVSDLRIHEPSGGPAIGLFLHGSAQGVVVDLRDNPVDGSTAVSLHGDGSFTDGAALASLASPHADYGLTVSESGDALISNVQAEGRYAITTDGAGNKTLRFMRATGNVYGVQAKAESTLIDDSTFSGAPVVAYTGIGATSDILTTVRHVTVKGAYVGVHADDGITSHMNVSNTAVVGGDPDPETADAYVVAYGTSAGVLDIDYSFLRAAHALTGSGGGTETLTKGVHDIDGADANLLDVVRGDLRPRWDSPLIDAGDPVPGGGEPMADLAGGDRTVNGRTDIGAYEYGRHTPTISTSATPISVLTGETVHLASVAEDADPNERPDVTWAFDDGTTATGVSADHAFATPGTHTVTATATDPAGLTATAFSSVIVSAPPAARAAMAPTFRFKSLKARKGVVRIVLRCPVIATDCAGKIELRLGRKVLGRARYAIAHGTKKTIKVKLTKSARKRLRKARHGLRVKVVVKPKGAASKNKTVRLTGR